LPPLRFHCIIRPLVQHAHGTFPLAHHLPHERLFAVPAGPSPSDPVSACRPGLFLLLSPSRCSDLMSKLPVLREGVRA
jgi:hypothetical protein